MTIDSPYFDLAEAYPHHYKVFCHYDMILRGHGYEIYVRDTDHWYHSVRWEVRELRNDADKEFLKSVFPQLYEEFYSTCEKCGRRLEKYKGSPVAAMGFEWYGGAFPDEHIICDVCNMRMELWDNCAGLDAFFYYCGNYRDSKDAMSVMNNTKIKFVTADGRVSYCRVKDMIRISEKENYLIAPIREDTPKSEIPSYIIEKYDIPAGYEIIPITPIGYDVGLRDREGNRIYSSEIVLFDWNNEKGECEKVECDAKDVIDGYGEEAFNIRYHVAGDKRIDEINVQNYINGVHHRIKYK